MKNTVYLSTKAYVETSVTVELERKENETYDEYYDRVEQAAIEKAESGNVVWKYDSVVEPYEILVDGLE